MAKSKHAKQSADHHAQLEAIDAACKLASEAIFYARWIAIDMECSPDSPENKEAEAGTILGVCEEAHELANFIDQIQTQLAIPGVRARLDVANPYPVEIAGSVYESYVVGIAALAWNVCKKLQECVDPDRGFEISESDFFEREWAVQNSNYVPPPTPRISTITQEMIERWHQRDQYEEVALAISIESPDLGDLEHWQNVLDGVDPAEIDISLPEDVHKFWRIGCKKFADQRRDIVALDTDTLWAHLRKEYIRACQADIPANAASPVPVISSNEERDRWIYEQCCLGTVFAAIIKETKRRPEWYSIDSISGIKMAADRYRLRHHLPEIPRRQAGRRPQA